MIPREEWEWFGIAGHLIVGSDCQFHLTTRVGSALVSTVGEYLPDEGSREIAARSKGITLEGRGDMRRADFMKKVGWLEIGLDRTYETMVFPLGDEVCQTKDCNCGMPVVTDWTELDMEGYNSRGDAQRGHYVMCERWAQESAA